VDQLELRGGRRRHTSRLDDWYGLGCGKCSPPFCVRPAVMERVWERTLNKNFTPSILYQFSRVSQFSFVRIVKTRSY